jgi:hypothetical protein
VNERIRELAEQAGFGTEWFEEAPLGYPASPREGIIKNFAELIVTECVKILVTGEGNENTSDAIWDLEQLGVDVSKILDGVEE